MVKKKSSFGRAPPRSMRGRLIDKGYQGYNNGQVFEDREVALNNWTEKKKNVWYHKDNRKMVVAIVPNRSSSYSSHHAKWLVFHTHPGPYGTAVIQGVESAKTMKEATRRAYKHLRHWNDPTLWTRDPDYGKIGKTGA